MPHLESISKVYQTRHTNIILHKMLGKVSTFSCLEILSVSFRLRWYIYIYIYVHFKSCLYTLITCMYLYLYILNYIFKKPLIGKFVGLHKICSENAITNKQLLRCFFLTHSGQVLYIIQKPVLWFAIEIRWVVSMWNETLGWNELTI